MILSVGKMSEKTYLKTIIWAVNLQRLYEDLLGEKAWIEREEKNRELKWEFFEELKWGEWDFVCINRKVGVKGEEKGNGIRGCNYKNAPWPHFEGVWTRTVERETGTDVGKASDFVGYYQNALLTDLDSDNIFL